MLNNPWILGAGPMTQVSNHVDGLGGSGHMVVQTQSLSIASSDGSVIHQTNTYESWVLSGPQQMNMDMVPGACPGQTLYNSLDIGTAPPITSRAPDAYLALPVQTETIPAAPTVAVNVQNPFVTHNQVEPVVALPTQMAVAEPPLMTTVQNPSETFIAVPVPSACDPLVAVPAVQNLYNPLVSTSESSMPMLHTTTPQTTQTNMPSWYLVVQDLPNPSPGINGMPGAPSVVRTDDGLFLCMRCNSTFEKVSCINWHLQECKGSGLKTSVLSMNGALSSPAMEVRTLQCSHCSRLFNVLHEPSSQFICSDCSSQVVSIAYPSRTPALRHFKCSDCEECFQFEQELEEHQSSHRSTVTICELPDNYEEGSGNERDSDLAVAEPTVESPEDNDECASLRSESSDEMEPEPSSSEICGECGNSYSCCESLNEHVKTHGNIRSYGCTKCGIICVGRYSLNRHVWIHTRESEDKENIADSCFEDRGDTKDGIIAQPFGCTECGMQFSDSNNLKEHCVSHLRSKPFLCTRCGEKFETTNSLERHWEAHALEME